MKTKKPKLTRTLRVSESAYQFFRKLAYKNKTKIIRVIDSMIDGEWV